MYPPQQYQGPGQPGYGAPPAGNYPGPAYHQGYPQGYQAGAYRPPAAYPPYYPQQ